MWLPIIRSPTNPRWRSYFPLLTKALSITTGPVIEFGAGYNSTPWLDEFCKYHGRTFLSFENNFNWSKLFKKTTQYVPNYNNVTIEDCSVALIDHGGYRKDQTNRFNGKAEIIVVHDTNCERNRPEGWKYYCDLIYKKKYPWSTAASNIYNVSLWSFDLPMLCEYYMVSKLFV